MIGPELAYAARYKHRRAEFLAALVTQEPSWDILLRPNGRDSPLVEVRNYYIILRSPKPVGERYMEVFQQLKESAAARLTSLDA